MDYKEKVKLLEAYSSILKFLSLSDKSAKMMNLILERQDGSDISQIDKEIIEEMLALQIIISDNTCNHLLVGINAEECYCVKCGFISNKLQEISYIDGKNVYLSSIVYRILEDYFPIVLYKEDEYYNTLSNCFELEGLDLNDLDNMIKYFNSCRKFPADEKIKFLK